MVENYYLELLKNMVWCCLDHYVLGNTYWSRLETECELPLFGTPDMIQGLLPDKPSELGP